MKIKKINVIRPEVNVSFNRPIIGRICFLFNIWRFVKLVNVEYTFFVIKHGCCPIYTAKYIVVPKFKVVGTK